AGGGLEPEFERFRETNRHHPVLEGVGGVEGVVLDPQLAEAEGAGEALGPHQRGEAGAEVDGAAPVGRQQVGVAPDARRALGDLLPGHRRPDGVVVVGGLERPETPLADVERRHLVGASAFPATELRYERHWISLFTFWGGRW